MTEKSQTGQGNIKVFVSTKTLAEIFDTSTSSIWRMVKRGDLPKPIKVNGLTRHNVSLVVKAFEKAAKDA